MNIRKLALPLAAVVLVTACDGLKDALTAHTDVAARVEKNELSVTRLGDVLGNTTLQIAVNREVATILTDLWTSYQLLGVASARRDSLNDPKLIDEATLGISATSRLRRFMQKKAAEFKADSATEATYVQAPHDLFVARHILFAIPGGATQQQKDSVKRIAEGVRARVTGANFADLAKRYSADPGSRERGGDLGPFRRPEMVGPFGDAVAALKPGEISPLVETSFGYHIVQRSTYADARQAFGEAVRGFSMQKAESTFYATTDKNANLTVKSNAATVAKNAARDLGANRRSDDVLATYKDGELTVGRFVTWVESFPQAQIAKQMQQAPDSIVREFVKSIARQEIMLKMAESEGITVDTAEQARVQADFKQLVQQLWVNLGIDPASLDSARSVPERERLVAKRVDDYLDRIMTGQANPITVPPPVQFVMMSKYESKIFPAGIDRGVERAKKLRATLDSSRSANQPPSQVPLPSAPGARPDSSKRP
jgi:hypothetical protein